MAANVFKSFIVGSGAMNMQSNKIEKEAKMEQESTGLITVDGVEYKFSDMTDAAKAQLSNIQ